MRNVSRPTEPLAWEAKVRIPGTTWLNIGTGENRNAERPSSFWLKCRQETGEAFRHMCCYTAVYVANGEADHFTPWATLKGTPQAEDAYSWSNIRYCDGWINRSKGASTFPDPFVVQDDWFELQLPSLELRETGKHPPQLSVAMDNLLRRVKDDDRVMTLRRQYFAKYNGGSMSIQLLDSWMPLLGRALRRNPSFLTAGDLALHKLGKL